MQRFELLGKTIRIINMRGEPDYAGRQGVIEHVDGLNQLHGTWGNLAIIPEVDIYEFVGVDNETNLCES